MCFLAWFFFHRWEALSLWLGRLWVEVCPIRWTHSSLQKAHRPPPFPVPALWQSVLQVGPPCLTHEEALLIWESSGSFPPTAAEIQYFTAQGLSSTRWGELFLSTTDNRGEVFQRVEKRDNCIWTLQLTFFFIVIHFREPKTLGSMTGSSIIPFVNPTWIISGLQNAKEWLEVTDIRVKQTVCSSEGGDITQGNDIPLISFQCNIRCTCRLVLSFFFFLLKAITMLKEEEKFRYRIIF